LGILDPREYAKLPADIRLFWKTWYNRKMDLMSEQLRRK